MGQALLDNADKHAAALGFLATAWAGLDTRVHSLFEPLLGCSEAQVACSLVENFPLRCERLKKRLHAQPLPEKWTQQCEGLLSRASSELASNRNRYIQDGWHM